MRMIFLTALVMYISNIMPPMESKEHDEIEPAKFRDKAYSRMFKMST